MISQDRVFFVSLHPAIIDKFVSDLKSIDSQDGTEDEIYHILSASTLMSRIPPFQSYFKVTSDNLKDIMGSSLSAQAINKTIYNSKTTFLLIIYRIKKDESKVINGTMALKHPFC
ncbi:hypothetical protein K140096H11_42630 [Bacteroides intestinalis]